MGNMLDQHVSLVTTLVGCKKGRKKKKKKKKEEKEEKKGRRRRKRRKERERERESRVAEGKKERDICFKLSGPHLLKKKKGVL